MAMPWMARWLGRALGLSVRRIMFAHPLPSDHIIPSGIYLQFFTFVLFTPALRLLLPIAILLLTLEVWILRRVYRLSYERLSATFYLFHGINFFLFLPLYTGYLFAKSDTSAEGKLPRVEVRLTDGAALENMIVLRGMERGVLLWDGKGKGNRVCAMEGYPFYEGRSQRGRKIGIPGLGHRAYAVSSRHAETGGTAEGSSPPPYSLSAASAPNAIILSKARLMDGELDDCPAGRVVPDDVAMLQDVSQ